MKKHITLILAIIATLCMSMFFVACGNKDGDDTNKPQEPTTTISVTLNKNAINMVLGTTDNLTAITTSADGYALTWSSSDSSIVTVADGKLEAMKQGSATITATYSNGTNTYTDSANVVVGLGGNAPVLCVENRNDDSAWNVLKGQAIEFVPYVYFNGMKFYDVEISVTASVDGIASYENNTLTAVGKGSTELFLEGTWRGISFNGKNAMSVEIPFNVLSNYEMALNGEAVSDVKLYTRESWGGKTYATSLPFVVTVKEDGEFSASAIDVIIDNEDVVTYNNGVLSFAGFGETNVKLSWTSSTGELYERSLTAIVERPIDTFETVIDNFSAIDGLALYDADKDGLHVETSLVDILYGVDSGVVLVDGYQTYYNHGTKSTISGDKLTVTDNAVLGVFSHALGFQEVEIALGTATEIYNVTVKSASKVFANDNIDEWAETILTDTHKDNGYTWYKADGTVSRYTYYWPRPKADGSIADWRHVGYYTLCEDINGGLVVSGKTSGIFAGVFDGRGHVIDNTVVEGKAGGNYQYRHGLFGQLASLPDEGLTDKSVKITNVAFTNVEFQNENCVLFSYQINGVSGSNPEITNVYVEINEQAEYKANCFALSERSGYLEMRNVIVDYQVADTYVLPEYTADDALTFGSLIGKMSYKFRDYTSYQAAQILSDVYVISTIPLGKYKDTSRPEAEWMYDGENIDAAGYFKCVEAFRYNTIADMKAANNDYSAFVESGCWTIVDGIPVFNALVD